MSDATNAKPSKVLRIWRLAVRTMDLLLALQFLYFAYISAKYWIGLIDRPDIAASGLVLAFCAAAFRALENAFPRLRGERV